MFFEDERNKPSSKKGELINPSSLLSQGLPNLGGGNAGAGSLDFLRNSPQVQIFIWLSVDTKYIGIFLFAPYYLFP